MSLVSLQCHEDIRVCRGCIGWLHEQSGSLDVTPILPVLDLVESQRFYEAAGFEVRVYEGGGYAFVSYEGESVFDLGLEEHAAGAGCYVIVPDVDAWHQRLAVLGYPATDPEDQDFGMREFTLTDPSGNRLRLGHPI